MKDKLNLLPFFRSINVKMVIVIILLLIFALELVGANFITQIEEQLVTNFQEDRHTQVDFLENAVRPYLEMEEGIENDSDESVVPSEEINNLLVDFSGSGIGDIQVVDTSFTILGLSDSTQQANLGQLSYDSTVRQAILQDQTVTQQVVDPITGNRHYKIAEPVQAATENAPLIGAVVMESNIETVYDQIEEITWVFLRASFLAIIFSVILASAVSRALTTPIKEMQAQTKKIAEGDYSGSLKAYGSDELGQLALLINDLSDDVYDAQESIDSERRRLNSVLANMTEGVISTDRRGNILIINRMAEIMLGVKEEEVIDKNLMLILGIDREINLRELIVGEENVKYVNGSNIEGQTSILKASFSFIQRESGFITGVVCVLHDVTEQERIEEERKEFVSNVSHELRTPLTSMRSYIEALSDGAWQDEELAPRFLEVTRGETDRMIRMIQDLLHLSRIDSGRSQLEFEVVDIRELLNHVLNRFEMLTDSEEYTEKTYVFKRDIINQTVFAEIDPDRFTQVLDNLINNAIKYSPDGGQITSRLTLRGDNKLLISISDQGLGIPKEDLNKIFTRFYRVDKARSRAMGGSGLGLAISKEVVEQHNGNIWAKSQEGKGTTFFITLPIVPFEEEEWA